MRIGLTGGAPSVDKIVAQAQQAEADGFSSLWFASVVAGDPLVAIAIAGRATASIELGTAVLQTYPCHPLLQANRAGSVANAMGRAGFTLGLGPAHAPLVEGVYGLRYDHPGRSTEEYLRIVAPLLRGEQVDLDGEDWSTHSEGRMAALEHPVSLLLAGLGPRMLQLAGHLTDGVVSWLAPVRAVEQHLAPRLIAAAEEAGRPRPRLVAGLPVAVHDDVAEARAAFQVRAGTTGELPNYRRVLELGGAHSAGDAAIVGDEAAVATQLQHLIDAGATDIWAAVFPVGDERRASIRRTTELLASLADGPGR